MRKLVYGALALSAALAVSFGVNVKDADAATASDLEVTSDGDKLVLNIGGANSIQVGVPKFAQAKDGKNPITDVALATVSAWDYYDVSSKGPSRQAVVDLSKYGIAKDNYLAVKADYDTDAQAVLIKIPASVTLGKATDKGKLEDAKGKIEVVAGSGKAAAAYTAGNLEFYTDNDMGDKEAVSEDAENGADKEKGEYVIDNYVQYQYSGATLYVREKGKNVTAKKVTSASVEGDADVVSGYKFIRVGNAANPNASYVIAGRRPSKAVKVAIAKLANAPKLTVDYVTGKISVGKNIWYKAGDKKECFKYSADFSSKKESFDNTAKLDFFVGKDINTEGEKEDPFYIDVKSKDAKKGTESKLGRTVFQRQTQTVIDKTEGEDEEAVTTQLVKAEVVFGGGKYTVNVYNEDTEHAYIVTLSSNTNKFTALTKTVAAKKATATTPVKLALAPSVPKGVKIELADISKLKISVQTAGDKTAMTLPGLVTVLDNNHISVVSDGDVNASFGVATGLENIEIRDAEGNKVGESGVKADTWVTVKSTDKSDIQDLIVDWFVGKSEKKITKADAKKGLVYKLGEKVKDESGAETDVIDSFTFKMPAYNITIK